MWIYIKKAFLKAIFEKAVLKTGLPLNRGLDLTFVSGVMDILRTISHLSLKGWVSTEKVSGLEIPEMMANFC